MPRLSELKETTFWMLAILGAFALVYAIGWYGEMIARIH